MATILSRYYGVDELKLRKAHVTWDGRWYSVDLYHRDELIERRPLKGHAEGYAEDAAENYVMGYGEFAKRKIE
jgi:hypothetical protein